MDKFEWYWGLFWTLVAVLIGVCDGPTWAIWATLAIGWSLVVVLVWEDC